jgi:hypothetical protein
MYIPDFIKIGSVTQKLIRGDARVDTQTASLLLFFQNKESKKGKKAKLFLCLFS